VSHSLVLCIDTPTRQSVAALAPAEAVLGRIEARLRMHELLAKQLSEFISLSIMS
jgi:hypothetical protein